MIYIVDCKSTAYTYIVDPVTSVCRVSIILQLLSNACLRLEAMVCQIC